MEAKNNENLDNDSKEIQKAGSRTVVVDNVPLDLGITSKELLRFFLSELEKIDEKNVFIVDIDAFSGVSSNSVTVELMNVDMVPQFKKLDGIECLGEKIKVRKMGDETT